MLSAGGRSLFMLHEECRGTATSLSNSFDSDGEFDRGVGRCESQKPVVTRFCKHSFVFQLTKGVAALVWPHVEDAT